MSTEVKVNPSADIEQLEKSLVHLKKELDYFQAGYDFDVVVPIKASELFGFTWMEKLLPYLDEETIKKHCIQTKQLDEKGNPADFTLSGIRSRKPHGLKQDNDLEVQVYQGDKLYQGRHKVIAATKYDIVIPVVHSQQALGKYINWTKVNNKIAAIADCNHRLEEASVALNEGQESSRLIDEIKSDLSGMNKSEQEPPHQKKAGKESKETMVTLAIVSGLLIVTAAAAWFTFKYFKNKEK